MKISVDTDTLVNPHRAAPSAQVKITKPVQVGSVIIGGPEFTVIAGPCSIESKSQFEETARAVKAAGAVILRGGVWKLRTSAQTFQGLGNEAFAFIKDILNQTKMKLVSEVTDPRQIALLDDYVEMYQVGSRNMHNYALLKELGLTKKPVMLKRGFAAFVDEWIKAAEYISIGGNDQVVLCERGIRTFETSTRNTLDLNSVIYVKEKTHFPVIVDPSHAIGVRQFVPQLALAAAAAGADGIIVEVHPRPAEALSDGPQALTIPDFQNLMKKLERVLQALDRPLNQLEN
ncbi:MAG: 3-deoxy-7-phosphoheptulonate synthase [Pseudobdellovibrionaceae bacterium]